MKHFLPILALGFVSLAFDSNPAAGADAYQPGPDSNTQEGVPKGDVLKFTFDRSKIFPGTTRDYWIYVPKQYDPAQPACLWVNQDGIQFNAPVVFDNLISKKEIPVTIGVFIMHGRVKAPHPDALDRFNRSYEYDGLGDAYVRFVLDEILPEVELKTAPDGRPIRLSKSASDHAIGGSSSGAIAAFTAAWERPDAFQRVFSSIGTFVDLRGGNVYPSIVRKFEPKPIRVFLQDGSADQNIYGGDWWMANQELERALAFSGYDVNHVWGDGGHNGKQAAAIFPDAVRWLWKDWPAPIKAGVSKNAMLQEILIPGEDWQLAAQGYKSARGPAANAQGEVFFNDAPSSKTYKIGEDGTVSEFIADSKHAEAASFGPDGRLYLVTAGDEKIAAYTPGKAEPAEIASGFKGGDLVLRNDRSAYVTNPSPDGVKPASVWLIKPGNEKTIVDTGGVNYPKGVTLSPDQTLLYVGDGKSHWVYSYQIQADGSLADKQRYFWLHCPDSADDSGADGMKVDRDGRLYVATLLGLQVCDQAGRVNCIIPTPNGKISSLTFGGKEFDTIYAACGEKIFRRKVKVHGTMAFQPAVKPAPPHL